MTNATSDAFNAWAPFPCTVKHHIGQRAKLGRTVNISIKEEILPRALFCGCPSTVYPLTCSVDHVLYLLRKVGKSRYN